MASFECLEISSIRNWLFYKPRFICKHSARFPIFPGELTVAGIHGKARSRQKLPGLAEWSHKSQNASPGDIFEEGQQRSGLP